MKHHLHRCVPDRFVVCAALMALVTAGCGAGSADQGEAPAAAVITAESEPMASPEEGLRVFQLQVDFDRLLDATADDTLPRFIRLPDGETLDFRVDERDGEPTRLWRGTLHRDGARRSSLTLMRSGQRLSTGFSLEGVSYRITGSGSDGHRLIIDTRDPPEHQQPLIPPAPQE